MDSNLNVTWSCKYLMFLGEPILILIKFHFCYAVTFSRIDPGGQLVMGFRKATNSTDVQVKFFTHYR